MTSSLSSNFQNKAAAKRKITDSIDKETMKELLQNNFMNKFIEKQREEDRSNWLASNLLGKNRTFKNFINNNSNILRRFKQKEKLTVMRQIEQREQ